MLSTLTLFSTLQYAIQQLFPALQPSSDTEEVISQNPHQKLSKYDLRKGLTFQEALVRSLKKLEDSSFQRFIEKLSAWKVRDGYRSIPKDELTGKDPEHVAGLINEYYGYAYGAEVAMAVLEDLDENTVLSEFQYDLSKVDISGYGLGTTMFTAGFLERHRLDLISRVIMVDPILDDLRDQGFLEHKQYDLLRRQSSIRKKITELLDIVSYWEDSSKNKFFESLCAHNPSVIIDLHRAEEGESTRPYPYRTSRPVTFSDPCTVLGNNVRFVSQKTAAERTQQFYTLDFAVQSSFGSNPIRSNHGPFTNLDFIPLRDRKHFVDEHCWDLIRRIIMVDPVIDDLLEHNLLTQEQYDALTKLKTPQKKMIDLYDIIRSWPNLKKDQVYLALRQHNPAFIRVLEKSDQKLISGKANKGSHYQRLTLDLETGSSAGEHFLDKNKSGLINVMNTVDPVVEDLRGEGLLTEEHYHNILLKETSREKMEEIYNITDSFDNVNKDKVYLALRTHNCSYIRVMERICKPSLSVSEHSGDVTKCIEPMYEQEDNQNAWVTPGSIKFTITCSVCMEMYNNPVTLICGHNYCLNCIEKTWNNQDRDDTSCPICRRRFKKRPELNKNLVLCQIAEFCQSTKSDQKTHERCTYCTHCTYPKNMQCSIHHTVLEYYCSQDSALVCAHCCIVGEHKEHQVIPIREAMEIKKDRLRDNEKILNLIKSETEKYIKICMQKIQEEVHNVLGPGTDVYEAQEMREILQLVQGGLPIEKRQATLSVEDLIRHLEAKRSHLSQCISHIEELCYDTDPFLVLQDQGDYSARFSL